MQVLVLVLALMVLRRDERWNCRWIEIAGVVHVKNVAELSRDEDIGEGLIEFEGLLL